MTDVPDPRSRDVRLASLVGPVRPRDPALAERFDALDPDRRREVARAALDVRRAREHPDRELVRGLAETYASRVVAPMVTALGLAILVLMTIWGFGRSAMPGEAPSFLLVGGVAGLVTLQLAGRRMLSRSDRARKVHEALSGRHR